MTTPGKSPSHGAQRRAFHREMTENNRLSACRCTGARVGLSGRQRIARTACDDQAHPESHQVCHPGFFRIRTEPKQELSPRLTVHRARRSEAAKLAQAKRRAAAIGISLEEYQAHVARGLHHCGHCRKWKRQDAFNLVRSGVIRAYCRPCCVVRDKTRNAAAWAKQRGRGPVHPKTTGVTIEAPPAALEMMARGDYALPATSDPVLLYRAAMADPARRARFAAKQAEVVEALRRVDEAEEEQAKGWRAQQRRAGRAKRGNRKPIAVGREFYGGAS